MDRYNKEPTKNAVDAISRAQELAFAPMAFQASRLLCKLHILECVERAGDSGASLSKISGTCDVSEYGADVLLSMGLSAGLVFKNNKNYVLAKTGYFLLHDEMTKVNMAFTHDVCYQAMFHLEESVLTGKPAGLKVFGEWDNLYQGLTSLPEPARTSWYDFDHFYSDHAFDDALDIVFALKPSRLFDIGGNTGKWAMSCANYDQNVDITLFDLPQQLDIAGRNINAAGLGRRVSCHGMDLLDRSQTFPGQADVIWMSQFLDCFQPEEIVNILQRVKTAMHADSTVCIMETLWDKQEFSAASYSLNATSLYFTALANGNSRMYSEDQFSQLIKMAGLDIVKRHDDVGLYHSIFECRLPVNGTQY